MVGGLLREQGLTLAVAESATGGRLADLITEAPGASDYFRGGAVVYSREAKARLGVSADILDRFGTVAAETSRALAAAARREFGASVAIATTGVAGPGLFGEIPEGTLFVAVDVEGELSEQATRYSTTRTEFKRRGALDGLYLLWRELRARGRI